MANDVGEQLAALETRVDDLAAALDVLAHALIADEAVLKQLHSADAAKLRTSIQSTYRDRDAVARALTLLDATLQDKLEAIRYLERLKDLLPSVGGGPGRRPGPVPGRSGVLVAGPPGVEPRPGAVS